MTVPGEQPDPYLSLQRTSLRDYRAAVVAQLAQYWLGENFLMVPPAIQASQIKAAVAQADALLAEAEKLSG